LASKREDNSAQMDRDENEKIYMTKIRTASKKRFEDCQRKRKAQSLRPGSQPSRDGGGRGEMCVRSISSRYQKVGKGSRKKGVERE